MNLTKKLTGYKATDKDMICRDHKFVLGEWYTAEGELELCGNGFHFCEQPSGPWGYYDVTESRIFKIEAEDVLKSNEPGAATKCVARRIRLVEEISVDKGSNVGHWNVGGGNTGDSNTGNYNTGYSNSGCSNLGDVNTGWWNTGRGNTGDYNVGTNNTGAYNIGSQNTGLLNVTNNSPGCCCVEEPNFTCFDIDSGMTRHIFMVRFGDYVYDLKVLLLQEEEIDYEDFKHLPGCTPEKLKVLHEKYLEGVKTK